MCEAMRRLMKDEIADEIVKAQEDGEMKKAKETAYELYDEDGFSPEKIAKRIFPDNQDDKRNEEGNKRT